MKRLRLILDIEVPEAWTPGTVFHHTEQILTAQLEEQEYGWKIINGSAALVPVRAVKGDSESESLEQAQGEDK
jgi:hypothetical protein